MTSRESAIRQWWKILINRRSIQPWFIRYAFQLQPGSNLERVMKRSLHYARYLSRRIYRRWERASRNSSRLIACVRAWCVSAVRALQWVGGNTAGKMPVKVYPDDLALLRLFSSHVSRRDDNRFLMKRASHSISRARAVLPVHVIESRNNI